MGFLGDLAKAGKWTLESGRWKWVGGGALTTFLFGWWFGATHGADKTPPTAEELEADMLSYLPLILLAVGVIVGIFIIIKLIKWASHEVRG